MLKQLIIVSICIVLTVSQDQKWWERSIVYQIYPRSFQDSDGDGTGDLSGITQRLDHLVNIGVGAIWLSPIYKSPMADFGYDISDYKDVDPIFGTMDDFDLLSYEANARDIKIIMDFVPNHSSNEHDWFLRSERREDPYTDYYIWRDRNESNAGGVPNNWLSVFRGSAWEWSEVRQQFYYHAFTLEQPDLNYWNPAIIQEMKDILKFWTDKGVAGFRMDAVPFLFEDQEFRDEPESGKTDDPEDYNYLSHVFTWNYPEVKEVLADFTDDVHINTDDEGVVMLEALSEDLTTEDMMGFYSCSDFPFNFNLIVNLKSENFSGHAIHDQVADWLDNMPEGKTANWVLGNHDNWRLGSRFGAGNIDGFNMMSLLLPGVAVTYNGEEIGMVNTEVSWEDTVDPAGLNCGQEHFMDAGCSRDPERTPMQWDRSDNAGFTTADQPWLPVNTNYLEGVNVEDESRDEQSHLSVYQAVSGLRSSHMFSSTALWSTHHVFSFYRHSPDLDIIMLMNVLEMNVTITLETLLLEAGVSCDTGDVIISSSTAGHHLNTTVQLNELSLLGYEALVLKLNDPVYSSSIYHSVSLSVVVCTLLSLIY